MKPKRRKRSMLEKICNKKMEEFDEFCKLVDKSVKFDPWVKNRKFSGYLGEIKDEVDEVIAETKKDSPDNNESIKEEMGDILYDWLHACKLAEDEKLFKTEEAIKCAIEKLKRRKPYLLEDRKVSEDEAVRIWMKAKEDERKHKQEEKIEYVWYVDEDDNEIGRVSRKDSVTRNLWHRGTGIIVLNSKGEILVHQRTASKDRFPEFFDMFFGGNVTYGETYEENAERELFEEAGIKDIELEHLFKNKFESEDTKCHNEIYRVVSDGPFEFQKEEVQKAFFVSTDDLLKVLKKERFCPDSIEIFKTYLSRYGEKNGKR
jgi:isopentenyldiphosphate isomerase/NTP pyrophosphatase (non-canonical NTP hydrolase)